MKNQSPWLLCGSRPGRDPVTLRAPEEHLRRLEEAQKSPALLLLVVWLLSGWSASCSSQLKCMLHHTETPSDRPRRHWSLIQEKPTEGNRGKEKWYLSTCGTNAGLLQQDWVHALSLQAITVPEEAKHFCKAKELYLSLLPRMTLINVSCLQECRTGFYHEACDCSGQIW